MIDYWKQKLIDFSKKNSLLYFKFSSKSYLELTNFSDKFLDELLQGKSIRLENEEIHTHLDQEIQDKEATPENINFQIQTEELTVISPEENIEILTESASTENDEAVLINEEVLPISQEQILDPLFKRNKLLDRLRSRDRIAKQDLGANILYLAYGFLEWKESEYSEGKNSSPLFLIPLYIDKSSGLAGKYSLMLGEDEDIAFNPALRMFLKERLNLSLDFIPEKLEEEKSLFASLEEQLQSLENFLAESPHQTWQVSRRKCISVFNFQKLVLFKEMDSLGHKMLKHPIISKLSQKDKFEQAEPRDIRQIDKTSRAEENFCVLDADSSQLESIQAAKDGISFVLDGPPGTGKSQTITNIIAELISQGKKVLFVSEKKAALNVVRDRLQNCGLDNFCLVLHDTKKKDKVGFLKRLSECFDRLHFDETFADYTMPLQKLDERKYKLLEYVEILHKPFGELQIKPYEAYSKAASLADFPDFKFAIFNPLQVNHLRWDKVHALIHKLSQREELSTQADNHPWSNIQIKGHLSLTQKENLSGSFKEIIASLELCRNKFNKLFSSLEQPVASSLKEFQERTPFIQHLLLAPVNLAEWLSKGSWSPLLDKINEQRKAQQQFEILKKEISEYSLEGCTEKLIAELIDTAQKFKEEGGILQPLLPNYNQLRKKLSESFYLATVEVPELETILDDLHKYSEFIKLKNSVESLSSEFQEQCRNLYQADNADLENIEQDFEWLEKLFTFTFQLNQKIQEFLLKPQTLKSIKANLEESLEAETQLTAKIAQFDECFSIENWQEKDLISLIKMLNSLKDQMNTIDEWIDFCVLKEEFAQEGLSEFLEIAVQNKVSMKQLSGIFEKRFYAIWIDKVELQNPILRQFRGDDHNALIESFRELEKEQFQVINRKRVFQAIQNKFLGNDAQASFTNADEEAENTQVVNKKSNPTKKDNELSPLQIKSLRTLAQQKRPRKSIRRILKDLRKLVLEVHPCWMMSPLSVCQFIELAKSENPIIFDTIIFDEASQIFPEDAICSIFRAKQMIVAGDPEQMPPTSFGKLSNFGAEELEDEDDETAEFESILNLASIALEQKKTLGLKWHYRSKYEELIHPANKLIYDNKLITFPAANQPLDRPVKFVYVEGAIFDRGKSKTNPKEANQLAEHLIQILREQKQGLRNKQSVGIIALGAAQTYCIEEEIQKLRMKNPDLEDFFNENLPNNQRIFVKNLETVQGDERDIILLSVGYGKDQQGKLYQNFGPINQKEVGHRRLNVAVTRAKEQMIVFCSFHHFDLKVNEDHSRGLRFLRDYLRFAETEQIENENEYEANKKETPLIQEIRKALSNRGFIVRSGVGRSEYKVDLAIVRPNKFGSYVLGIECDGNNYQSGKTVRDRDRLRQEVLENYGWHIHRVWSRDWWQNSERELQKIQKAVDKALIDVSQKLAVV